MRYLATFILFISFLAVIIQSSLLLYRKDPERLVALFKKYANNSKEQSQITELFYDQIGNFPPNLDDSDKAFALEQFTLEFDLVEGENKLNEYLAWLANKNIQAFYTPLQRDGKIYYQIRQGVFDTAESAQLAKKALKENHQIDTKVSRLF